MGSGIVRNNCSGQKAFIRAQQQRPALGGDSLNLGYSPYGYRSHFQSLLCFSGDRPDSVTGHYLLGNGHRAYIPSLMRFSSPDSMSPFAAGGLNSYAYCHGDPINLQDPSGRTPVIKWLASRYRSTFPRTKNLPARYYIFDPKKQETEKNLVTFSDIPDKFKSKMDLVKHTDKIPSGYELIGFHGSSESQTQSLESGIDASHAKRQVLGNGFYASPSYEYADKYTKKGGRIFGVYASDFDRWGPGKQYEKLTPDILLIRAGAFDKVIVRSEIRMPLTVLK